MRALSSVGSIDSIAHSPLVQIVVALLAGGIGLPIPEELALVGAGYYLARHAVSPATLIPAALLSALAGDVLLYCAGRGVLQLAAARRIAPATRARLEQAFSCWGARLILVGRFVPGLRSALLVAAGAARMSPARMLACDGCAALAGAAAWIAIGYRFGEDLARARLVAGRAQAVVVALALVAALIVLVRGRLRRRRALTGRALVAATAGRSGSPHATASVGSATWKPR